MDAQSSKTQSQASPPTADHPMTAEETREELRQAIEGSKEVLVSATTTWSIFPDTLTVDRAKLTVIHRNFLRSAEVVSIRIEDILNATSTVGPILGSVKIVSRVMNADKPYTIGKFWRGDAIRIKRITQGYVIALQREIDCSALGAKELSKMLEKLGEDDHDA